MTRYIFKIDNALYKLHFQLDEILNMLTLAKQGIISSQIIGPTQFMDNYRQALQTRSTNTAIESKIEHFQFILDISDLSMFVIRDLIFFKISTPIISGIEWDIFQLYPIPTIRNQVFMALLLEHQIYLLS